MTRMDLTRAARTPTLSAWDGWIANASPGDVTEYYTGYLAKDAGQYPDIIMTRGEVDGLVVVPDTGPEWWRLARTVMLASQKDLVHLVQTRWRENIYHYYAVRRMPRPTMVFQDRSGRGRRAGA